ncbi:taxifolin 8-monooxygenase [Malassezia yamatoensis]|uniref:L-ornithine N(5)-monooxygenase [NAD(P)H] n=1 Tax=Malassezia yamatoensis TaxID=253288 RepID=A0AAJ5YRZ9_9BASI|nr:taxifolin 8-monooxygenase [Malassezia yamatoensis]
MSEQVYDLAGIGFGPANLALCIALHESEEAKLKNFSMIFLEMQPQFAWHPALLLPGAQLQVSPIKDLATMRDPTSAYSFLNFLHSQGRLAQYINREQTVPSRREWSAYLAWAAQRMDCYVRYSRKVVEIKPKEQHGKVAYLEVLAKNHVTGETETIRTRNITTAVGGLPNVPSHFRGMYEWPLSSPDAIPRVIHASAFLPQMERLDECLQRQQHANSGEPLRLAIVGGGQSSAEMLCYLRDKFPRANLDMIVRASALVPSDDSPFVNSAAFDPASVTTFWESNAKARRAQLEEFRRTNYSVIRSDLLSQVYEMVYDQEIDYSDSYSPEKGMVRIMASTEISQAEKLEDGRIWIGTYTTAGEKLVRSDIYDAVFLGTGFERAASTLPFVNNLADQFPLLSAEKAQELRQRELDEDTDIEKLSNPDAARAKLRGITRDYRLVPSDPERWRHDASSVCALHPSVMQRIPQSRMGREGSRENSLASSRRDDSGYNSSSTPDSPSNSTSTNEQSLARGPTNLYLFGCNEYTHGLSDSLMSMVAHRAGVVSTSLLSATNGISKH